MAKEYMYTFKSLRILPIAVLTVILLLTAAACRRTPQRALDAMDRAESLMEEHPDSALAVMQTVDTADLHGAADRARRALLMTMAVDKNLIDTADFRILQPAIDYYERHGSPDQRLKTRYYQGRIYMDQGKDDAALTALLRAAEDSATCKDSLALARLYILEGTLRFREYEIRAFIRCNEKAGEIYKSKRDTLRYLDCRLRVLNGYTLVNDSVNARAVSQECDSLLPSSPELLPMALPLLSIYHRNFDSTSELERMLSFYEQHYGDLDLMEIKLDYAFAHYQLGHYSNALEYVLDSRNDLNNGPVSQDDSIKYNSVSSVIYESNGMLSEALAAYKGYVENITNQHSYLFNSGILLTDEKYGYEKAAFRDKSLAVWSILRLLGVICICIVVICIIYFRNNSIRTQKKLSDSERNEINLKYMILEVEQETLKLKQKNSLLELERTRQENEKLSLLAKDLEQQLASLQMEKEDLRSILDNQKSLNPKIYKVITKRIEMLDKFFAGIITGDRSLGAQLRELERFIREDQPKFFSYLRNSFEESNPLLMEKCREAGLTQHEVDYVCLLAIGLRSKEIGTYFDLKRINSFASDIRKKLHLTSSSTTLSNYIKNFMEEEFSSYRS